MGSRDRGHETEELRRRAFLKRKINISESDVKRTEDLSGGFNETVLHDFSKTSIFGMRKHLIRLNKNPWVGRNRLNSDLRIRCRFETPTARIFGLGARVQGTQLVLVCMDGGNLVP